MLHAWQTFVFVMSKFVYYTVRLAYISIPFLASPFSYAINMSSSEALSTEMVFA
jgi:hypothetical protein